MHYTTTEKLLIASVTIAFAVIFDCAVLGINI